MSITDQTINYEAEIKLSDRAPRVFGYIIVILAFGLLGSWSFIAPLDSAAFASGSVVVKSFSKVVQHLDGGIVEKIFAKDGDEVDAGDLLIKLDATQARAQQEIIRGQFLSMLAMEARLLSEQRRETAVKYPQELLDSTDARAAEIMAGQNEIFKARQENISGEINVLKQRIGQLDSKIGGFKKQYVSKQELRTLYLDEIGEMRTLLKEGFVDKLRLREMERKQAEVEASLASIAAEQSSVEIQVGETEIQILQLQNRRQEEVALELGKVQSQLIDLREKKVALDDLVARTDIRAPASGFVVGMTVHTEGGVVSPGNPILHIVPEKDDLIISARVNPNDIDRVKLGLHAEIRFTSYKQGATPKLTGEVIHLSADSLMDENTGEPYYEAKLEISEKSKQDLKVMKVIPGMPVEVLISTGERTLWQYLVQPITDAYARALIED